MEFLDLERESHKYERFINKEVIFTCPSCNSRLILKINSFTGKEFYGCESFPSCRFSRTIF
jgi:ssDNA-binding Zn-finger/Zn-ribbon topoisomerase 1